VQLVAATTGGCSTLVIADARPQVAAFGNTVMGAGYEQIDRYKVAVEFLGIDNIHAVRDAYRRLCDLCAPRPAADGDLHYWAGVSATRWLEHVLRVLQGSVRVAGLMEAGHSVLVHCSDGWDRTSQLTSLAMLLLDEHYRTLRGFATLVEKEWVAAGHQFRTRSSHGQRGFWSGHCSPVFLQWLDCVRCVQRHYPAAFEFNEALLVFLAEHVFSCRYGTFLFDSERELIAAGARERTLSVWSFVLENASRFIVPECVPVHGVRLSWSMFLCWLRSRGLMTLVCCSCCVCT
jgi:myotubularin-related protein 1/2